MDTWVILENYDYLLPVTQQNAPFFTLYRETTVILPRLAVDEL